MARPWKKKKRWPHVARSGAKSYAVGFYDHEGKESTRSFPSARIATEWMEKYSTAERRGTDSLRRFLLDLDAREANARIDGRTIGDVIQLYLAHNAPEVQDGLARSTFRGYKGVAKRHLLGHPGAKRGRPIAPAQYAGQFAAHPAENFNDPESVRWLREAMIQADVGPSARSHTWRFLSAVLSWAAQSSLIPEIRTNACLAANEKLAKGRKSMRTSSVRAGVRRRGEEIRSWALAPVAVELIRAEMIARAATARRPLLAYRDATVMSLQFGLALRDQEVYGIRWTYLERGKAYLEEVVSENGLEPKGKTANSTERPVNVPSLLESDLDWWRERLEEHGHPTRPMDFVIPGDLAGKRYGRLDKKTGARYMTASQADKWGPRYMTRAVNAVASRDARFEALRGATPYGLRRGGISTRLRHEDAQSVADQCGTSLVMLSQHYSYEIKEFLHAHAQTRTVDETWRAARAKVQSGELA
jgi:hypothetical protein